MPGFANNKHRLLGGLVLVVIVIGVLLAARLLTLGGAPASVATPARPGSAPAVATIAAPASSAPAAAPLAAKNLSIMHVIVSRNDTLERIFRRLALSLSDLASL